MNREKNFVSAVIYVHNAEHRVQDFVTAVIGILERNFEHSEVICVNDDSSDGSLEEIRATKADPASVSLSVVNMSYYHGVETAMNAGTDLAIGDFVFEFDDTILDFTEETVLDVYRRALEGYDIVSAFPDRGERLTSRLFYKAFEQLSSRSYHFTSERFRILSRRVINRISTMNTMTIYRKAVYANCGLKTDHIVYKADPGKLEGKDRQERKYRRRLATDSLILFTEVGYRFSIGMTLLMMFLSVVMVIYTLVTYFTAHPVEGWTTTILFLSLGFFGLFGILTIAVKYLQLIVDMVFRRKHYSFESVEKITE